MSCHKGLQAKSHPNQQLPVTPSLAKRKQVQQSNAFRSPTDNLISPCSMRILKKKKYVGDPQQQCVKSDINGKENEGS